MRNGTEHFEGRLKEKGGDHLNPKVIKPWGSIDLWNNFHTALTLNGSERTRRRQKGDKNVSNEIKISTLKSKSGRNVREGPD